MRAPARARVFVAVGAGKLRPYLTAGLRAIPELTMDTRARGRMPRHFTVDGAVTKVSRKTNGDWVEMTCEVKLSVSDRRGRILSIVSSGATAMRPRDKYSAGMDPEMQSEALEGAVQGAHGDLVAFLTR